MNYTGRRTIGRSRVTIRLHPAGEGETSFSAEFDLAELRFPPAARVYVEAYNTDSYMRFNFGTVGEPTMPANTRLSEVTPRPLPKFRLKVVDETHRHGLLLGVADKLIPLRPNEDVEKKQSLLPVDFVDLGERVWRLDLNDWPVLELNRRIEGIAEAARTSGSFFGLLYPEVFRQILRTIVVANLHTDPNADDGDWTTLWLKYACSLPGVEPPPTEASQDAAALREEWIESTVQAFCRDREARQHVEAAVAKELA